jgi:hypothetical protein
VVVVVCTPLVYARLYEPCQFLVLVRSRGWSPTTELYQPFLHLPLCR